MIADLYLLAWLIFSLLWLRGKVDGKGESWLLFVWLFIFQFFANGSSKLFDLICMSYEWWLFGKLKGYLCITSKHLFSFFYLFNLIMVIFSLVGSYFLGLRSTSNGCYIQDDTRESHCDVELPYTTFSTGIPYFSNSPFLLIISFELI